MWAALSILLLAVSSGSTRADEEEERFFETQIRPLLSEYCLQCHGPDEQSAQLRLDTHADLLKGGESGPVIVPGRPAKVGSSRPCAGPMISRCRLRKS